LKYNDKEYLLKWVQVQFQESYCPNDWYSGQD